MTEDQKAECWRRLLKLLGPDHDRAAAFARRLSRGSQEGDDLFQEALLRAHDRLVTLRDESKFRPWFYAILLSLHRNRSRRSFWRRFLPIEGPVAGWEPAGADGSNWDHERRGAERASRALASLPPEQREAVVLFELEEYSIEEIAALTKASIPAVKSRLVRGRRRLRRWYEKRGLAPRAVTEEDPGALPLSEGRQP